MVTEEFGYFVLNASRTEGSDSLSLPPEFFTDIKDIAPVKPISSEASSAAFALTAKIAEKTSEVQNAETFAPDSFVHEIVIPTAKKIETEKSPHCTIKSRHARRDVL